MVVRGRVSGLNVLLHKTKVLTVRTQIRQITIEIAVVPVKIKGVENSSIPQKFVLKMKKGNKIHHITCQLG